MCASGAYCYACRTMHEKCLYIEALKRGFEALGRPVHITNMNRLEEVRESTDIHTDACMQVI